MIFDMRIIYNLIMIKYFILYKELNCGKYFS
nr:MAG TPA: hypothetical protein [Bacteriophage sp.]